MVRNFYYRKQADIVSGSSNFAAMLVADGAGMGVSPTQISGFGTLNTALQSSLSASSTPETRTPVSIEGANEAYRNEPLDATARAACIGEYAFGPAADQRLVVTGSNSGGLTLKRAGDTDRALFHQGGLVFHPPGAEAVRIQFAPGSPSSSVTVTDGAVVVVARRA